MIFRPHGIHEMRTAVINDLSVVSVSVCQANCGKQIGILFGVEIARGRGFDVAFTYDFDNLL